MLLCHTGRAASLPGLAGLRNGGETPPVPVVVDDWPGAAKKLSGEGGLQMRRATKLASQRGNNLSDSVVQ